MSRMPRVTAVKTIHKGYVLTVLEENLELENGSVVPRDTVQHPGAVVIVPVDSLGQFHLVRQFRHAVRDYLLEFPAGTLEPGEGPEVCAERELAEEIGKQAKEWESLGSLFPAPGFCNEIQHYYIARDLSPATADPDEDEILTPITMSLAEVEEAIRSGGIKDGKSVAAFTLAKLKNLF